MSRAKRFGLVTIAIAGVLTLGLARDASAGLINCPAAFITDGTANVTTGTAALATAASLCQHLYPPNNSVIADVSTVNAAGFFGVTTWGVAVPKYDVPNGGALSGTWSIPGANFASYQYMITFKDGNGTNLVSFLLNGLSSSGNWYSPFSNPPFAVNNTKDVSHFSIFQSASRQVPEPSTLALLGLGFGIGVVRLRKKSA
jgi:hypothetical protein